MGIVKLKAITATRPRSIPRERIIDQIIRDSEHSSSGDAAADVDSVIGGRIRTIREQRGESLRAFASRCGVSASMLSDVERGAKSPTIAILSAIAEGLEVPLSRLVSDELPLDAGPRILRAADMAEVSDPETGVVRSHLGPLTAESKVEFLRMVIPAGESTGGFTAHASGTIERVYIAAGSVDIGVGAKIFRLESGDAILYRAAVTHSLKNPGDADAEIFLVVERP